MYNILTGLGYKVFFAPRSLVGVKLYEPKIYSAIISSKAMIVLGTRSEYLEGVWVKNEWSRFIDLIDKGEEKILVPVFKNMKANEFPSRFSPYQAYNRDDISFLDDLKTVLAKWVKRESHISFDKDASAEEANLERGFLFLEDGDFSSANSYFEKTLDINPHNSQAYFGKLMVEMRVSKQSLILTSSKNLKEYANFEKAVRFADHQLKVTLLQYEEKVQYALDEQKYNRANALINKSNATKNDYEDAAEIFREISGFKDVNDKAKLCFDKIECFRKDEILQNGINKENSAPKGLSGKPYYEEAISIYKSISGWKDADERLTKCEEKIEEINLAEKKAQQKAKLKRLIKKLLVCSVVIVVIIAIVFFIFLWPTLVFNSKGKILLKNDGTVISTGSYGNGGEYDVSNWTDIVAVCDTYWHTVGLKSDGTVVAVGANGCGQCDVDDWRDIVAISAGDSSHTVGLKSDGTVVAAGEKKYGQCNVSDWTDIVAISAKSYHTIGVKSDGTVVATGKNEDGQCSISDWTDIVSISTNAYHTVGLKSDGTVIATGRNYEGQLKVEEWTDIVAVSAGGFHTVGLKSDGTVVAIGSNEEGQCNVEEWTDIVSIFTSDWHTVGIKSDGTIVYAANNVNAEISKYKDEGIIAVELGV